MATATDLAVEHYDARAQCLMAQAQDLGKYAKRCEDRVKIGRQLGFPDRVARATTEAEKARGREADYRRAVDLLDRAAAAELTAKP